MKQKTKGFTLIELMIVVAIISIIAGIAIPGMLRSKISANESSAISALRSLASIQSEFKSQNQVDQDNNGESEYGLLGELTGSVNMRGRAYSANPNFMSKAFSPENNDAFGQKAGYLFKIYLPGDTAVVTDNGTNPLPGVPANAKFQEVKWRCYAWPIMAKSSGNKVYAVDQSGGIFFTENLDTSANPVWNGPLSFPPYNAACNAAQTDSVQFLLNIEKTTGASGQRWQPTN